MLVQDLREIDNSPLLHKNFKEVSDRAVTCFKICRKKLCLLQEDLTIDQMIDDQLAEYKQQQMQFYRVAKEQKTVDYTLPEMLYALRVYKLAAEHHCHLKFTLT